MGFLPSEQELEGLEKMKSSFNMPASHPHFTLTYPYMGYKCSLRPVVCSMSLEKNVDEHFHPTGSLIGQQTCLVLTKASTDVAIV